MKRRILLVLTVVVALCLAGAVAKADTPLQYTNVTEFGADPTGAADSSGALNAAWNVAAGSTRRLLLPPGQYKLLTPITWTGTKRVDVTGDMAELIYYGPATSPVVTYGGFSGGKLTGLSVKQWASSAPQGVGVKLVNLTNASIELESLWDFQYALWLSSEGSGGGVGYLKLKFYAGGGNVAMRSSVGATCWMNNLTFRECRFETSDYGIALDAHVSGASNRGGWWFERCSFETSTPFAIFGGPGIKELTRVGFDNCWFENNHTPMQLGLGDYQDVSFRGCEFEGLSLPKVLRGMRIE